MHSKRKKKMFDFMTVEAGLAGINFAHLFEQHGKSLCLLSDHSRVASLVIGGVYNPVVLRRSTPIWKAEKIMARANRFYDNIEATMGQPLHVSLPVLREFASIEEQSNWFAASDTPILQHYLSTILRTTPSEALPAPYLLGGVLHTERLDTERYIRLSLRSRQEAGMYHFHSFDYSALDIQLDFVAYQGVTAQHIVFREGCGISRNPYFNSLPIRPCKGESLTTKAPGLQLRATFKGDGSIIGMGVDIYRVRATYDPGDLTDTTIEAGRAELPEKLHKMMDPPCEIISHQTIICPTVGDRHPLVGAHPLYPHLWVLNGLGTRSVLNAPLCVQVLYKTVFEGRGIPPEMSANRFSRRLRRKG